MSFDTDALLARLRATSSVGPGETMYFVHPKLLLASAADMIERQAATARATERLPEVEFDDDGTVTLSWRDGAGAFDISILPSGKVVGTHSPATRGIKPWTVFLPGRQAIVDETLERAARAADQNHAMHMQLFGEAPDDEAANAFMGRADTAMSLAAIIRSIKGTPATIEQSSIVQADRQAIRAEAFREAAKVAARVFRTVNIDAQPVWFDPVTKRSFPSIAAAIEALAGEPDAAFPVQTGETI